MSSSTANAVARDLVAKLILAEEKLLPEYRRGVKHIIDELRDIETIIADQGSNNYGQEVWIRELQNLVYSIEDCIDRFIFDTSHEHEGSLVHRALHAMRRVPEAPARSFAEELEHLKQRVQEARQRIQSYVGLAPAAAPVSSSRSIPPYIPEVDPADAEDPMRKEILELVAKDEDLNEPRVISVVGFLGVGKTTLASKVYHTYERDLRFWVVASECRDATELLMEIYRQVCPEHAGDAPPGHEQLIENLTENLSTKKRYLIVIDDMQKLRDWHIVESSFPSHGRIIVTTRFNSVAEASCSRGCYVYRMQALDEEQSRRLLEKMVSDQKGDFGIVSESMMKGLLKKCEGLPLALLEVSQFLRGRDSLTVGDQSLSKMKQVLTLCYNSLSSTQKTLLLSLSIYPEGYTVRKKSLVRRWIAEGLVMGDVQRNQEDVANQQLMDLVDWNLIQPVDISYNGEVKTFKVHGVMLDFIVHKAVDENFVTLIHNDKLVWNDSSTPVRRLSLYKTGDDSVRTAMDIDLSHVRSLAILKHQGKTMVHLRECMLLRVLDLESCRGLNDTDLEAICSLPLLKYLSLRGTAVTKIPKKISKLQSLETLDIRETGVELLPMEVLVLPRLTCLLGRFRLHGDPTRVKKNRNLLEQSRLGTLAGIELDESPGFENILAHMRYLRKIKIWSKSANAYLNRILAFIFQNSFATTSLSIDFGNDTNEFLRTLEDPYTGNSIKLRGTLNGLPNFIINSVGLEELCLFSTGLSNEQLSELQTLHRLRYLKLVDDFKGSGSLEIRFGGFRSLERLWIEAKKLPEVSIEEGSMQQLTSLHLLCDDVSGLPVETISHLERLREIALSPHVSKDAKEAWGEHAKAHPNRPTIKF